MRDRCRRTLFTIALLGALLPAAGAAQSAATAGLHGRVRDAAGPVSGATVEAVESERGGVSTAQTDDSGGFALFGLRPGIYTLTISAAGRAPVVRRAQLLVGQDAALEIVLAAGEAAVDAASVAVELPPARTTPEVVTNVTPQQVATLPLHDRDVVDLAVLAPGVRTTLLHDGPSRFRSGAQDSRQTNAFIDGLSYKSDLLPGGAFLGEGSPGNPFPLAAVQELRVFTQNYGAEHGKASAAVLDLVTRSGGKRWNGELFYLYQDESMVSQDDLARDRGEDESDFTRRQWGATVGGPLLTDRLHAFLTYERQERDRSATVTRGSSFASAPANVQQQLAGYPTGDLGMPFDEDLWFGKLSWQAASAQDAQLSYFRRDELDLRGFGGQRTADGAQGLDIGADALTGRHQWVHGRWLNEAGLAWQRQGWNPGPVNDTARLNYIGILDVGGADNEQDFEQERIALRDDLSYFLDWHGSHTVRAGISWDEVDASVRKTVFDQGLYELRSEEQWQFPFHALVGVGDPEVSFDNEQLGVYLQDDWQVLPRLSVRLGVRWDYETDMLGDTATPPEVVAALAGACRTYAAPVGGSSTWCLRDFLDLGRYTTDGNDREADTSRIQPRLGFTWDLRGDARTVVFGAWGKYSDRVVANDIYDAAWRQQYRVYDFCFSAAGGPASHCVGNSLAWNPSYLSADVLRGLLASGRTYPSEIFLLPNDLEAPESTQYTLGLRQQLGRWTASLAYGGVESEGNLIYFFGDLPPGTDFSQRFGGNVPVDGYSRVFIATPTGRRWYDAVYLTLDRPLTADSGWGFDLAYTYAKAERTGTDNPGEGIVFGAFDYLDQGSLYRFPDTEDERHRLVMAGTVRLPGRFLASALVTLGSGTPYTIFDDSSAPFTVRWNEGRPAKDDFIVSDAWAYRSVDLRLEWEAPPARDVRVALILEGFNVFDHDNGYSYDGYVARPPAVNANFGQPYADLDPRRLQVGARVSWR